MEGIEDHPGTSQITHSRVVPSGDELRGTAIRMLRLAALQEEISREEANAFARETLNTSEAGRLALQVLDGGEHAIRALVELAALVSKDSEEQATVEDDEATA